METGQKTIQKTNNKIDHISLSIQVNLNGFSFCILNKTNTKVLFYDQVKLEKKTTPIELLSQLTIAFKDRTKLQQDFESVVVIHDNELSTLVPNELFDETHLADYLKFNSRILQTDFIAFDSISSMQIKNVYVPYVNVNNFVYENFGEFSYLHSASVLLESLVKQNTFQESVMYVHFTHSHFDVIALDGKQLKLSNRFEYRSNEDVIYYLLFVTEQLQLDPEIFKLIALGQITEESELFQLIYSYIRHASIMSFEHDANLHKVENNFIQANSF